MATISDEASVMMPLGQNVSKSEFQTFCNSHAEDASTVTTQIIKKQLVSLDKLSFVVEVTIKSEVIGRKGASPSEISYPAAYFVTVDSTLEKVTEIRVYAQNMAVLAARGYKMVPDQNNAPLVLRANS
ncbi:unnamed protein product [Discosporangium mesarthrocarpum]